MTYRYKEKFEKDNGFRLFRNKRTVLLQALSYGRRFTEQQLATYVRSINEFLDAVGGRTPMSYGLGRVLTIDDFPEVKSEPFYKYVSDSTWEYIKTGSIQLGTAPYYRRTENLNINDQREGSSTFHLTCGTDQLNISIMSGFNCALFCGTVRQEGPDHTLMRSRFGTKLIKIEPADEFIARVCKLARAYRARAYDVVYTDLKNFAAELEGIQEAIGITGKGDLTKEALHKINTTFFQTFYDFGFLPSLLAKPTKYSVEHERRIIFEIKDDLKAPTVTVKDASLLKFITLIDD